MERLQRFEDRALESGAQYSGDPAKEILITPAAIVYVLALIAGGLGILSFFVFAHTLPDVIGSAVAVSVAVAGAAYAVRSVVRGLRA